MVLPSSFNEGHQHPSTAEMLGPRSTFPLNGGDGKVAKRSMTRLSPRWCWRKRQDRGSSRWFCSAIPEFRRAERRQAVQRLRSSSPCPGHPHTVEGHAANSWTPGPIARSQSQPRWQSPKSLQLSRRLHCALRPNPKTRLTPPKTKAARKLSCKPNLVSSWKPPALLRKC